MARLSDEFVEDGQIKCPLHQGKFCIKTGKSLCAPLEVDVQEYPAELVERDSVSEVSSISGQYDLMAKCYLKDAEDIGRYVETQIHSIPGIRDTPL